MKFTSNMEQNRFFVNSLSIFAIALLLISFFSDWRMSISNKVTKDRDYHLSNEEFISLDVIDKVMIQNKLGNIELKNNKGSWKVVSDNSLPINEEFLEKFHKEVIFPKIINSYQNDDINRSTFSLSPPHTKIKITNALKKSIALAYGLENSIDNSTYLLFNKNDQILQIEKLNVPLSTLSINNFINTKIFQHSLEDIEKIEINFQHSRLTKDHIFEYKDNIWISNFYQNPKQKKLKSYIESIITEKPILIFDTIKPQTKEFIDNYFNKVWFQLSVVTKSQKKIVLKVGRVINEIPGLNLNQKSVIAYNEKDNLHYLLNEDWLESLQISYKNLH